MPCGGGDLPGTPPGGSTLKAALLSDASIGPERAGRLLSPDVEETLPALAFPLLDDPPERLAG